MTIFTPRNLIFVTFVKTAASLYFGIVIKTCLFNSSMMKHDVVRLLNIYG